ncbi:WXG100-like domain-containing protein [Nocardia cyriacigeorgica]|uniref:WXG100-like domain-containing protein n=1 Tax=Nocardia cyriacigeorgica TaxID=135487 RepID=UPI0035179065
MGLLDDGIGIANAVGIQVPDGDTDQLQVVADAWNYLATQAISLSGSALQELTTSFLDVDAADATEIIDDLDDLQSILNDVRTISGELSEMARTFKSDLDELRRQILSGILNELAMEIGTRAVLSFASSFVTFGTAAAIGAASVAAKVVEFGIKIGTKVDDWNNARRARNAAKPVTKTDDAVKKSDDIAERETHELSDDGEPSRKKPDDQDHPSDEKPNDPDPNDDVAFEDPRRPHLGNDGKYHIKDGDTDVQIDDPNDLSRTVTDIDKTKDGVLWEEKSAVGAGDVQKWVDKQVTKKLESYIDAQQYISGYENAPIGLEFTRAGVDPEFKAAVESAVSALRAKHPGVEIMVKWPP